MNLVDANVLIYAVNRDLPQHQAARAWLEEALSSNRPVGFASTVILAFLRLTTHPKIFATPLGVETAIEFVDSWLAQAPARVIVPGDGHWAIYRRLLADVGTGGNLTSDVFLAALALEHGFAIVSADHDFRRFAGLTVLNPFA